MTTEGLPKNRPAPLLELSGPLMMFLWRFVVSVGLLGLALIISS